MAKKQTPYRDYSTALGIGRTKLSSILNGAGAPTRDPAAWPEVCRYIRLIAGDEGEDGSKERLNEQKIKKLEADTRRSESQAKESELRVSRLSAELTTVAEVRAECEALGEL